MNEKFRCKKLTLAGVMLALGASACGAPDRNINEPVYTQDVNGKVDTTPSLIYVLPEAPKSIVWPSKNESKNEAPPIEGCAQDLWEDRDGKRRPPLRKNPLIVAALGYCGTGTESGLSIALRSQPNSDAVPPSTIDTVEKGELLLVLCTAPDKWAGVTGESTNKSGFILERDVGYINETAHNVPECKLQAP